MIPELILFRRKTVLKDLLTRKSGFLILGLALLFVLFPPPLEAHGLLTKMLRLLPNDLFKIASVYFLALLACVRFSRINLAFWALLMNCGLMMKAHQWDKYVLPLLVTFWYLKSVGALDVVTGLSKATVFEGDEPGHEDRLGNLDDLFLIQGGVWGERVSNWVSVFVPLQPSEGE